MTVVCARADWQAPLVTSRSKQKGAPTHGAAVARVGGAAFTACGLLTGRRVTMLLLCGRSCGSLGGGMLIGVFFCCFASILPHRSLVGWVGGRAYFRILRCRLKQSRIADLCQPTEEPVVQTASLERLLHENFRALQSIFRVRDRWVLMMCH
jgi:hypothetical protein